MQRDYKTKFQLWSRVCDHRIGYKILLRTIQRADQVKLKRVISYYWRDSTRAQHSCEGVNGGHAKSSQRENILITFGMLIMKKIIASNVLKIIVKSALLKCIVRKNHC